MDPAVQSGMLANQTALTGIAEQQAQNAEQLYKTSEPGFQQAEQFYGDLATGDPGAIMHAIAPAAQQINEASTGAKKNILENAPSGGEKNLALEMTDVNKGAEVGKVGASGYTGSFNALAQLAGQGVGESISAAGAGTSAYSAGSQTLGSLGSLNIQDKQLQMQQKGQTMGGLGELAQAGAGAAAGAMSGGGWEGALTALAL